jgi:hypothetical protein
MYMCSDNKKSIIRLMEYLRYNYFNRNVMVLHESQYKIHFSFLFDRVTIKNMYSECHKLTGTRIYTRSKQT